MANLAGRSYTASTSFRSKISTWRSRLRISARTSMKMSRLTENYVWIQICTRLCLTWRLSCAPWRTSPNKNKKRCSNKKKSKRRKPCKNKPNLQSKSSWRQRRLPPLLKQIRTRPWRRNSPAISCLAKVEQIRTHRPSGRSWLRTTQRWLRLRMKL